MTSPLQKSLAQLQSLIEGPELRRKIDDGSGQILCQRVVEECVRHMLVSMEKSRTAQKSAKTFHVSVARESCNLLNLVLESIAKRPQYETSPAARCGIQYLSGQVDRADQGMKLNQNMSALVPLIALLVNEFSIKDVTMPRAWFEESEATKQPSDKTAHVPVLAMAS